ncbi:GntR family transcriptional regulator, partial [Streptomyces sp. KAI-27]|nr:GntR family transcriptional regulator [Streptomyces sp. KAI-27]
LRFGSRTTGVRTSQHAVNVPGVRN